MCSLRTDVLVRDLSMLEYEPHRRSSNLVVFVERSTSRTHATRMVEGVLATSSVLCQIPWALPVQQSLGQARAYSSYGSLSVEPPPCFALARHLPPCVSVNVVAHQQPLLVGRQRQPSRDPPHDYNRVKPVILETLHDVSLYEGDCQLSLAHAAKAVKRHDLPSRWIIRNSLLLDKEVSPYGLHSSFTLNKHLYELMYVRIDYAHYVPMLCIGTGKSIFVFRSINRVVMPSGCSSTSPPTAILCLPDQAPILPIWKRFTHTRRNPDSEMCEGACFQVNAIEVTDVDELTSTKSSTIVNAGVLPTTRRTSWLANGNISARVMRPQ
ncbi:hypothetical protein KCU95_g67, partial [Aureobasidium melanogenum]